MRTSSEGPVGFLGFVVAPPDGAPPESRRHVKAFWGSTPVGAGRVTGGGVTGGGDGATGG